MADFSQYKVNKSPSPFEQYKVKPKEEEADNGAYLDSLSNGGGFWKNLPRDIAIGLTHLGRNTANLPHDISKLAEWPAEKLFGPLKHPLSSYLPYDTENYGDVFGQKGEPTMLSNLIQQGIAHAPDIVGGAGLVRGGARRLMGTHYIDQVRRFARENPNLNFSYTPQTVQQAERFLPRSIASNEMIEASNAGGFNPSFSMQSQIGHHQRTLERSPLAAEQRRAPQAGDLKQNMLGQLYNVLEGAGFPNEAATLRRGINNYRQYRQVMNAVVPILKQLKIPTTILSALGLGVVGAKKFFRD